MSSHKIIEYAYATSPTAVRAGHGKTGCHVLRRIDSTTLKEDDLSYHLEESQAYSAAQELDLPWHPRAIMLGRNKPANLRNVSPATPVRFKDVFSERVPTHDTPRYGASKRVEWMVHTEIPGDINSNEIASFHDTKAMAMDAAGVLPLRWDPTFLKENEPAIRRAPIATPLEIAIDGRPFWHVIVPGMVSRPIFIHADKEDAEQQIARLQESLLKRPATKQEDQPQPTQTKFQSSSNPDLTFWAQPETIRETSHWVVYCQVKGFPATEACDDWFGNRKDAEEIAEQLAMGVSLEIPISEAAPTQSTSSISQ